VQGGGRTSHFAYDADGERIAWYDSQEGATHVTLRDPDGTVLREYREQAGEWSWVKDYVYRDGQHLASVDSGGTKHVHLDHLGSIRRITGSGTPAAMLASHDYYPFGEEATEPYQDAEPMKYTGHERDLRDLSNTTDDLDAMHARYYNPNIGRFLSVDPGRDGDPRVPQAWNMYTYVRNNPVNQTDPDGRAINLLWDVPDLVVGVASIGNLWVKALSGQQITVSDNIDAISGAVGMLPIITGAAVAGKLVTFASNADDLGDAAKATEGVYEVTAKSGKGYVGQSSNIPRRLEEHVAAGKITPQAAATAKTSPVTGGKTAREVAEQKRVNDRGGIRELENKRNPIGAKRRHLLDDEKKQ
jgi:RHS repeat-associated protein